jgi:dTDP-4-dehydrorhamnose reductase
MKILLLGGGGQLGYEVHKRAQDLNFDIVSPALGELDISVRGPVTALARKCAAELIINCAAYTAVDKAEAEAEEAFRVNCSGARNCALAAKEIGARLIQISTDYVFTGSGRQLIKEDDPTGPLNVYGASKLAGEQAVMEVCGETALIVRTSSLHGSKGENFVHTMLRLFKQGREVKVVEDQWMCPTWAGWLAETLLDLGRLKMSGVVHACGQGVTSWFEFAKEILRLAQGALVECRSAAVLPCKVSEYERAAKRPVYSAMDCARLTAALGRPPIAWQAGLREHLRELKISVEGE